ncbi:MAG: hypothetical protein GVY19_11545 [Bacteroidetes bacterium]|jgi:hypothetical protein|nr:hypothetical protein [Bacteroidota bacterium]
MAKQICLFTLLLGLFLSCENNDDESGNPSEQLVYESLTIDRDTLSPGETTTITASATGYNIEYHWSATAGDLLGGGSVVTYAASPCHVGENTISCTVKDGNDKSETKSVKIVVE